MSGLFRTWSSHDHNDSNSCWKKVVAFEGGSGGGGAGGCDGGDGGSVGCGELVVVMVAMLVVVRWWW